MISRIHLESLKTEHGIIDDMSQGKPERHDPPYGLMYRIGAFAICIAAVVALAATAYYIAFITHTVHDLGGWNPNGASRSDADSKS